MSSILRYQFRYGAFHIHRLKLNTSARSFKQTLRAGMIMTNDVVPNSVHQTGYIAYTAAGGNRILSGFILPIPTRMFNTTVHLDRVTFVAALLGTAKVTQVTILSIAPTSSTLAVLYDDTDERNFTTDPTGVLDYDCDIDIPDGYSIMLRMYFTISGTDDFEIYTITPEYSLIR